MRIAVLGASGAAGRAFVTRASALGHTLVTRRADILDPGALVAVLEGCDAAVNLATSIPKPGGRGDWQVNDRIRREGTVNVLAACAKTGVRILVQQSVAMLHCLADDRPQTETDAIAGYGAIESAFDMEVLVKAATLAWYLVRGGLFYGPGTLREERWLREVSDSTFRIPGDGSAWISPVHVEDYADALTTVLEHGRPREAYIACDDEPLRLRELYERVAARAGVAAPAIGGVQRTRSCRVSNAKLRSLGWKPCHALIRT